MNSTRKGLEGDTEIKQKLITQRQLQPNMFLSIYSKEEITFSTSECKELLHVFVNI